MKNITIRVEDEVYEFFQKRKEEKGFNFLGETVADFFQLKQEAMSFDFSLSSKDKQWLMLSIVAFEALKLAEADIATTLENSGHRDIYEYIKQTRIRMDLFNEQIDKARNNINLGELTIYSDLAIIFSIILEMAKTPKDYKKIVSSMITIMPRGVVEEIKKFIRS